MAHHHSFRSLVLALWLSAITVLAYIPALPTNSTESAIAGGLNVTDVSKLHLQWYSNGSYWENVSYQLAGFESTGISKGALVHFTENKTLRATTTTTPWIALIACDTNGTTYSLREDIFTLARDSGAVAALLFSLYSKACIINPAYSDPDSFDQVFDIFSTQSLTSSHLIEYQFGQFGAQNESIYGSYDPTKLNDSEAIINESITTGFPLAPGYLIATLQAYNATGNDTGTGAGGSDKPGPNSDGSSNTGLAMIILYAITGCVSALFCVVIITGAIRAVRHPERYGPRPVGMDGRAFYMGQSRARGITRAILDTFPIVKFGGAAEDRRPATPLSGNKDLEASPVQDSPAQQMEMNEWEVVNEQGVDGQSRPTSAAVQRQSEEHHEDEIQEQAHASTSQSPVESPSPRARRRPSQNGDPAPDTEEVVPSAIGYATCPICIVDFAEGDDLRVLPCEGQHRFHQSCVDPWLLELSSSCPICRQDFQALETILSGGSEDDHNRTSYLQSPAVQGNRFSRYLRFARRRRHEQPAEHHDTTDPSTSEA